MLRWWGFEDESGTRAHRSQVAFSSSSTDAFIAGFESPLRTGRSVVLVASNQPAGLAQVMDALLDADVIVVGGGLAGLVAARTSPSLQVNVTRVDIQGVTVACIHVPKAQSEVATQAGVYVRRRIKHDGTPECVPRLHTVRL